MSVLGSVLRPEMEVIAVPTTLDGGNVVADDFSLTAGWGHFGQGEAVMPGLGRVEQRPYTEEELAALGSVPAAVWSYKLGGYHVLKKWLSYREHGVLGRTLKLDEVQHLTDTARRIVAILSATSRKNPT